MVTSQEQALVALKSAGFRITPQRRDVVELLSSKKRRFTVQEIHSRLKQKHSGLSIDTVYRTLATLVELGIVAELNLRGDASIYEYQGTDDHHHHHAICMRCGKAICLEECPVPAAFEKSLKKIHFQALNHSFEVYGYCRECQSR